MAAVTLDVAARRAALRRNLEDARRELAQMHASDDRYERNIEIPRILREIQRLERELERLDES